MDLYQINDVLGQVADQLIESDQAVKRVVQMAAKRTTIPMIRDWLKKDEHGTWKLSARAILIGKTRDARGTELTDKQIEQMAATELLDKILGALKKQK